MSVGTHLERASNAGLGKRLLDRRCDWIGGNSIDSDLAENIEHGHSHKDSLDAGDQSCHRSLSLTQPAVRIRRDETFSQPSHLLKSAGQARLMNSKVRRRKVPGGAAGLQNLRAFLTQWVAELSIRRRVSANIAFLFVILVGAGLTLRFAGFLRFGEFGTFRAKSGDQEW